MSAAICMLNYITFIHSFIPDIYIAPFKKGGATYNAA